MLNTKASALQSQPSHPTCAKGEENCWREGSVLTVVFFFFFLIFKKQIHIQTEGGVTLLSQMWLGRVWVRRKQTRAEVLR